MISTTAGSRLDWIAQELFDFLTRLALAAPRGRRRSADLKEVEFLTLALLHDRGTMIVGEIQRLLGVLPAQMSRIIRSLEDRPEPLISCRINPSDKRKIDVGLTDGGAKALLEYQAVRVHRIAQVLHDLSDDDQEELVRMLEKMRGVLERAVTS
jgi:DNA-binding MarR family transcriptional regulator